MPTTDANDVLVWVGAGTLGLLVLLEHAEALPGAVVALAAAWVITRASSRSAEAAPRSGDR